MGWKDRAEPLPVGKTWKDRAEAVPTQEKTQGPAETFLDKTADIMTLGYLPQIETVAEGLLPGTGKPFKQAIPGTDEYVKRRDELVGLLKKEQEDNPTASMAAVPAGIAGSIATLPATGAAGAVGAGAKALNALKGTAMGAGLMLAQNPGDKKGEVSPLQLGERASQFKESASTPLGAAGLALPGLLGAGSIASDIPLVQKGLSKIGKGASKVGEMFTGVPENEIRTYAKHADEIKKMAKSSDYSTFQAADQMRSKFAKDIKGTKDLINKTIDETLTNSTAQIDASPVLKALESSKQGINKTLYPEQVAQIDDIIGRVKGIGSEGKMSASEANEVKRFLQDKASSAYGAPGDMFAVGKEAAGAAKTGAAKARELLNAAEPKVANANNQLSKLHDILDDMNKNLITEGAPEAALLSAGSGGNSRNIESLKKLGEFTGTNMIGEADKLSSMRTFGDPKLTPGDTTGKAAGRMGLASGIGYLLGNVPGAVTAGALTSPAALKAAIDAGLISKKALARPEVQGLLGRGLILESSKKKDNK